MIDKEIIKKLGFPMLEQFEYIESIQSVEVTDGEYIVLNVDKHDIQSNHNDHILNEFRLYEERGYRSNVAFAISGYIRDPREIYQIDEIKQWFKVLYKKIPHLFYFLSKENSGIRLAVLNLVNIQSRNGQEVRIDRNEIKQLLEEVTSHAVAYAKKVNDPTGKQFLIANLIMSEFDYNIFE